MSSALPALASLTEPRWLTARRAFCWVAIYFAIQTLSRVLVSNSAELDESEQLLWTQTWAWGYGSDPPLYTWLQILVFRFSGVSVLGLALLKNTLLFLAFVFTWRAAREITRDESTSVLAGLSLFLFPQVTWESQRDLTHSVLATALAAATFWAAVRIVRNRSTWACVNLGLCVGLGTLSKYSYCLFALALALAALTVPEFRKAVLHKRMVIAVALAGLIIAPHLQWVFHSPALALSRPEELVKASSTRHFTTWLAAFASILKCAAMLGGVITVVYWLVFFRAGAREPTPHPHFEAVQTWIGRTLLAILLVCIAIVMGTAVELKDRWFQPVVFLGAIAAALRAKDRITPLALRQFLLVIAAIGAVMVLILPGIPLAARVTKRPTRLNAPYAQLSTDLKARASSPNLILAENRLLGGNLRLFFPGTRVLAPEFWTLDVPSAGDCLLVWDANKRSTPSPLLLKLVEKVGRGPLAGTPIAEVSAPYKYAPFKEMKLGYFLLPSQP